MRIIDNTGNLTDENKKQIEAILSGFNTDLVYIEPISEGSILIAPVFSANAYGEHAMFYASIAVKIDTMTDFLGLTEQIASEFRHVIKSKLDIDV